MIYNPYSYSAQPNPATVPIQVPQQASYQQSYFIGVPNEQTARVYPVAPGNSITFRDESDPCRFYTKTMGPSPLDRPVFEIFRLIREEVADAAQISITSTEKDEKSPDVDLSGFVLKTDLRAFEEQLEAMQHEISKLKARKKTVIQEVDVENE